MLEEYTVIDELLSALNDDELFYRSYFEAARTPQTLKRFLSRVDVDDARRRHLIIPELLPENISYQMNDDEYFSPDDSRNQPSQQIHPCFYAQALIFRDSLCVFRTLHPEHRQRTSKIH